MSFWGELKRRNVYKVGVAYAIVAWLLIQFAAIAFPHLGFPSWAVPFVIIILIIGFPVVLIIAWAFEVTPEGIKRTKEVPLSESITHLTGKKLNYILAGVIVLAVAYILFDKFYLDRRAIESQLVSTESEQTPVIVDVEEAPKTIAVLPFTDLSPEKDQEYFVDGLSEEILNSLTKVPDLHITSRTSSFYFKNKDTTIQKIADVLSVSYILEGSVRKAGNALRITAQLIRVADDRHLWSETYDRELKDTFAVQEDIATAVAGQLKTTLGIYDSIKILGGTDNQEAYELYLTALGGLQAIRTYQDYIEAFNRTLSSVNAAIELDPQFALAWSLKSTILAFNDEADQSLRAALRAIELQPSLPDGYAALGRIKTATGEFIEAALAYEKALELNVGPFGKWDYAELLQDVAYFKRAHEFLKEARLVDPLNFLVGAAYLENLGLLGDIEQAEKENERFMELLGNDWFGNFLITNVRLGSGLSVTRDQIVTGGASSPINREAKEHLESPKEGLSVLRRFYKEAENLNAADFTCIAFWAVYFGDPEFAMDSIEKAISIDKGNINNYWYPLFKEVRKLPRFKKLVRKIGIVDFWNKFGWPDICHQLDNGDFECD